MRPPQVSGERRFCLWSVSESFRLDSVERLRVGIIGVAGYGGGELARLLANHPCASLSYVSSESSSGRSLADVLPPFRGRTDLVCEPFDLDAACAKCDTVFFAQESGWASRHAGSFLARGKQVIDLSADLRLRDGDTYRAWYKLEPAAPEIQNQAVYGLPELNRASIQSAKLIANPGCYPTSAILALAPAVQQQLIDPSTIVINSLSGVSGAGRSKHSLAYHFPELNESVAAYGIAGAHRHTPEIEQALSDVAGEPVQVSFTPHLAPITRGIFSTSIAKLRGVTSGEEIQAIYAAAYEGEPFVHVLPLGHLPATKHTQGTNNVLISLAVDPRTNRLTVVSAEDNLVKGAAGQGIQNMNIMNGFPETAGLEMAGMWP